MIVNSTPPTRRCARWPWYHASVTTSGCAEKQQQGQDTHEQMRPFECVAHHLGAVQQGIGRRRVGESPLCDFVFLDARPHAHRRRGALISAAGSSGAASFSPEALVSVATRPLDELFPFSASGCAPGRLWRNRNKMDSTTMSAARHVAPDWSWQAPLRPDATVCERPPLCPGWNARGQERDGAVQRLWILFTRQSRAAPRPPKLSLKSD